MPNLGRELKGFVDFHRNIMSDWIDKLISLDLSVTESDDEKSDSEKTKQPSIPVITINKPNQEQLWFTSTETKQSFHHTIIDKQGNSSDLLIEVFHQFCREDYYSVVSRVLAIHEQGEHSAANTYLLLSSETLEQAIQPTSLVIIASIDAEPVAFALLNEIPNDHDHVSEILIEVVPHKRNSGIATALFYATLQHPNTLPSHIEAEVRTMNKPVFSLLKKAQDEGYIRYTLKVSGPETLAEIEILNTSEASAGSLL